MTSKFQGFGGFMVLGQYYKLQCYEEQIIGVLSIFHDHFSIYNTVI